MAKIISAHHFYIYADSLQRDHHWSVYIYI